jgi:ribosomal protein S18 acetylase RimI-like enzyme
MRSFKEFAEDQITRRLPKNPNPSFTNEQIFETTGGMLWIGSSQFATTDYSVLSIEVDEGHQRQGIATKLIQHARANLKGSIGAQVSSDGSLELFWKQGFRFGDKSLQEAKQQRKEYSSVNLIHPG